MISFREYVNRFQTITELAHFTDLMNQKGNNFIDELLNRTITVNLKIDQSAFVVGNVNGEIKYYGREGRTEITKHRRKGMDLYEEPIRHLESRDLSKIPSGVFVYLEFFDDRLPTLVKYMTKPKNNLIISYLKKDGKILSPAHSLNETIARLLDVSPPPVLFHGKLSAKQKELILDYANTPSDELTKKYGGKNFVQYVLSLFVPSQKMKYLMTDNLEGMVFYFDDGNKIDMAKINDPSFTEGIIDKGNKDDQYNRLMMEVIYDNLEDYANRVKASNYDDLIYQLTKLYIKHPKIKKLDKYHSQVTANRFSRLTFSLLPSKVEKLVNSTWYAEDVYRILHFLLEKPKRRANPRNGLTRERKEMVNRVVDKLKGI